jgi:DNA polymerase elongation subunit (family B)
MYGDTDSVMFTIQESQPSSKLSYTREWTDEMLLVSPKTSPCLLPDYLRHLKTTLGLDSYHAREYLCGNLWITELKDKHLARLSGIVPKLVNEILSYTALGGLKVEHQSAGSFKESGHERYVLHKMMVFTSKHYVSKDMTGELHSKGVSYVRRTGSSITDIAMRRFIDVALSCELKEDCIESLRREYNRLILSLDTGRDKEVYRVRGTSNGMTRDYVRLNSKLRDERKCKYAEFKEYYSGVEDINVDDMDLNFYSNQVKASLNAVCRCIGLPDESFITCGSSNLRCLSDF